MKSAGKARSNGLYRHIRTSKEIIRNLLNDYDNFLYRVLAAGIHVPVIPGIMPVINSKQIKRSCELSGTALPPRFKAIADKFSDVPEAMQQAGIAYATEQIIDLVANGVKYFHIYTMNRPETAAKIMENLSCILR